MNSILKFVGIIFIIIPQFITTAQNKNTTDEPQWSMNIYFEDATGATDILTFGYDPTAGEFLEDIEPRFGENWIQIDTTQFNVYIMKNTPPYLQPSTPPIDTNIVMKTSITSNFYPSIEIGWVHGQLPITITWDEPKLNSPSLPNWFPDNENCPKARIDMWFNPGDIMEPNCIQTIIDPYQPPTVILTNSDCNTNYYECTFGDNLIFDSGTNGNEITDNMWDTPVLLIVPFNDFYWDPTITGLEDLDIKTSIYPNPVDDILTIERETAANFTLKIYDLLGKQLIEKNFNHKTNKIDVATLKRGIYILKINDSPIKIIKK